MTLHPASTALVLIDLQQGILPFAGGPIDGQQVVSRAAALADAFRARQATVVQVRVGWSPDFADAPKQPVDAAGAHALPADWWDFPAALNVQPTDLQVVKHQWGAFYGTDLELQLRRRGIDTIVLGGIATNIGVESTARDAWERGFNLVLAEDVCAAQDSEQHHHSLKWIFPRLARVRSSAEIIAAL
ncbi:hydrolase [Pantoea sp. 1.19]|uniref:hydrolase n=1 Tax=Pantoea sp. 1.19 TaxID=1925589 RepID=UPI000949074B|nr:hydrolase [Pantoea sp. 1.19]